MLQIWNIRYSRHFWIIKCVGFVPILFAINLNVASFSKVLSLFLLCVYIDCIANLKKREYEKYKE